MMITIKREKMEVPMIVFKIQLFIGAHPSHAIARLISNKTVEFLHFFMEKWLKNILKI